jgi:enoyl-CoA hydratase
MFVPSPDSSIVPSHISVYRCDIILASPTAKFGFPEITLGVIPGGGGTQRLTGIIGKSRAMELVLTGRMFDAEEAEKWGVASRVVRTERAEGDEHLPVVKEALDMASKIANVGQLATQAGKEAVNACMWFTSALSLSRFACRHASQVSISRYLKASG